MGVTPAEDGTARWGADRAVGVGAGEAGPLGREEIHPGRLHIGIAHMAHGLPAVLIGQNVDDMWFLQEICSSRK